MLQVLVFVFFFSETSYLMLIKVPGSFQRHTKGSAHLLTQFPFRFSTKIDSLPAGGWSSGRGCGGGHGFDFVTLNPTLTRVSLAITTHYLYT